MDRYYPSNAEDTQRICTAILSDDASDDDRNDGKERNGDYVTWTVQKTLRRMIAEVGTLLTVAFHVKGQDEVEVR